MLGRYPMTTLRVAHRFGALAERVAIVGLRAYQVTVRPLLIGTCKFSPTCSEYAIEAIQSHGPIRGGWLTLRRLARCHPFGPGGIDPVPPA